MLPKDSGQMLSTLALVSQLGFIMAACVLGGLFGGMFLDRHFRTTPVLTVVLLLVGVGGGMVSIYRMVMRTIDVDRSRDEDEPQK